MDRPRKILYVWRMTKTAFFDVRINSMPLVYRCEAGWSFRRAVMPDFDLWYVLDGEGEVQINETLHAAGAHSCFLFPPGAPIQASHDPKHRLRVFVVHFDLADGPRFRLPVQGVKVRDAVFFAALVRRCEASYRSGGLLARRQSASLIAEMLLHLCAEAEQPASAVMDSRISAIVELIQEEPGRRWAVAELARRAGFSRSQFTRRFAIDTGLSPERFLIQARIERAARLLRETDMRIGQIADALGYCDVFHFSRQYRQVTGKTASEHRRE
jgi:AraC family transcriptional regulator, arabinose operon regulatory protein